MYPRSDRDRRCLGRARQKSGSPVNGTTPTDARVDRWSSMEASFSSSTNGSPTTRSTSCARPVLTTRQDLLVGEHLSGPLGVTSQSRSDSSSGRARNSSRRTWATSKIQQRGVQASSRADASDPRPSRDPDRVHRRPEQAGPPFCMLLVIELEPSLVPSRDRRLQRQCC